MARYDSIIVGGGHNGLVTAPYLARAGRKVLVLERRELVGGCSVTEEIWPGYRVSTAAYLTSLLQERLLLTTPPNFPPRGGLDLIDYLKLAGRMRGLNTKDVVALVKIFTQSAAE